PPRPTLFPYTTLFRSVGPPHTQAFMTGRDACRMMLVDDVYLFGSPTTVMVRADIVRCRIPFFTEGRFFEDADVIYEILRDFDFRSEEHTSELQSLAYL